MYPKSDYISTIYTFCFSRYVTRKEYDEDYKRLREKIRRLERKMEKASDEEKIIEKSTPSKMNESKKDEVKNLDESDVSS